MANEIRLQEIWPCSTAALTTAILQRMPDADFRELLRLVKQREYARTKSARHARKLANELTNRRNPRDHFAPLKSAYLIYPYKPSPILDALYPGRAEAWVTPYKRRDEELLELKGFSLIDDPRGTFKQLEKIVRAEATARSAVLDFLDDTVNDIGAYLILVLMRRDMMPLISGGDMRGAVRRVIEAVALRHFLGVGKFFKRIQPLPADRAILAFPIQSKDGDDVDLSTAFSPSRKEKIGDLLVDTINEWLQQLDPPEELTKEGMGHIVRLASEILDNAERHALGSEGANWRVAGFMEKRPGAAGGKAEHVCHLAFANIGKPISETISNTEDANVRAEIEAYVAKHRGKRLNQSSETLATVFALQDGVSRLLQTDEGTKGGVGMMDMVNFVCTLSGCDNMDPRTRVTIISGTSCIMFAAPYAGSFEDLVGRRVQWFNPGCNLDVAPDGTHVFDIDYKFPGTVIAVRFTLDLELLEGDEDDEDDRLGSAD